MISIVLYTKCEYFFEKRPQRYYILADLTKLNGIFFCTSSTVTAVCKSDLGCALNCCRRKAVLTTEWRETCKK
jgi:hypothetical protein